MRSAMSGGPTVTANVHFGIGPIGARQPGAGYPDYESTQSVAGYSGGIAVSAVDSCQQRNDPREAAAAYCG